MKSGIVKAYPSTQGGRAVLALKNESDSAVDVKHIAAGVAGGNSSVMLLSEEVQLGQHGTAGAGRIVDVSEKLLTLFREPVSENAATLFIRLHISPEPAGQPAPGNYRVRIVNGSFAEFSVG